MTLPQHASKPGSAKRPIGFYVHHQGRGHATHVQLLVQHLARPSTVFTSRPDYLDADCPATVVELPLDLSTEGECYPQHLSPASDNLHYAPLQVAGLRERMAILTQWIVEQRPTLMFIDVSVEVATLCRLLGVPTVVVRLQGWRDDPAHLSAFANARAIYCPFPQAFEWSRLPGDLEQKCYYEGCYDRLGALEMSNAGPIDDGPDILGLSTDAPPFATRADASVFSDSDRAGVAAAGHAGFSEVSSDVRAASPDALSSGSAGLEDSGEVSADAGEAERIAAWGQGSVPPLRRVLVLVGSGGTRFAERQLIELAAALPEVRIDVLGPLRTHGPRVGNLTLLGQRDYVLPYLQRADLVIGGAGNNVVMEVGACGKRFVCLPEERAFGEQNAKAKGIESLGLAVRLKQWPQPEQWPKVLAKAAALTPEAWAPYFHDPSLASAAACLERLAAESEDICKPADQKPVPSFL